MLYEVITGKTFAYLVPAFLAGGKVIVSTGTKTLQDQLYERDVPAVRKALATGATAALLKGRANYLCLYRLERARGEARLATREEAAQLHRIVITSYSIHYTKLYECGTSPSSTPSSISTRCAPSTLAGRNTP